MLCFRYEAALLFALEDYTLQFGYDPLTCTQKLCTWNKGQKKTKILLQYPSMQKEVKKRKKNWNRGFSL